MSVPPTIFDIVRQVSAQHPFGLGLFTPPAPTDDWAGPEVPSIPLSCWEGAQFPQFCDWDRSIIDTLPSLLQDGGIGFAFADRWLDLIPWCLALGASAWLLGIVPDYRICHESLLWVYSELRASHLPQTEPFHDACPILADLAFRPQYARQWLQISRCDPLCGRSSQQEYDEHSSVKVVKFVIGGNKGVSRSLHESDGIVHIFEPVQDFFHELHSWAEQATPFAKGRLHLHPHGVGAANEIVQTTMSAEQTGSYRYLEPMWHGGVIELDVSRPGIVHDINTTMVIKSIVDVLETLHPSAERLERGEAIILEELHADCVGCELAVIGKLHAAGLLGRVLNIRFLGNPVIEKGRADEIRINEDGVNPALASKEVASGYCGMLSQLRRTHRKVWGSPFFWEFWRLRGH